MSDNKNVDNPPQRGTSEVADTNLAASSYEVSSVSGSVQTSKTHPRVSSSSDRQIKFERAQKCLENAALVSKKIKEHRKATAELLGRPFEDDDVGDTTSEMATTMSERTGYSVATDTSTTLSVQDALNIPGISESLANTLKQKELLMERIKQYKVISKRPMKTAALSKESSIDIKGDVRKFKDNTDVNQLMNTIKEKENALSIIQVRMKAMETTILELQEKVNEKDQIIEAKNKATTLMSDSLSKKEKDSLALLEDTRQQMIKMQENFINMECEWKDEKNRLLKQIDENNEKLASLQEANNILENTRFEMSVTNSKLAEELELKSKKILQLQEELRNSSQFDTKAVEGLSEKEKDELEEEKGTIEIANMVELTKKIELLEQLNCQIRQTNKELENKLANINPEPKASSPIKKGSPLPSRKSGRSTVKKSPWSQLSSESIPQEIEKKSNKTELSKLEMVVQSLNKEILDKEYLISQKDSIITDLKSAIMQNEEIINELKVKVHVPKDLVEKGVCTDVLDHIQMPETGETSSSDPFVLKETLHEDKLKEMLKAAEEQIAILNKEIDAANKNMIKVKSNHKLKIKQMQKTIDSFSKVSDANAEIVKLTEELHQMSQRVAELEEEKGNLQLHLVDYDSGRLTESDVYKKLVEMESLAEARLKSISVLETQKFDLVQELHELQQKNVEMEDKLADIAHFQSEQVSSEIKSVQLEEQIDQLTASKKELELIIDNFKLDKMHLEETIRRLGEEKDELLQKLENYIQENMELTDKLEKLSAEKVSSAESIEIVESLTTQEKLELEEYNKGMDDSKIDETHSDMPVSPECQENIEKLVEQSAELNKKIELFTHERQEVMAKMNKITVENESLHEKILKLHDQCNNLENNICLLTNEKQELLSLTEDLNCQIEELKRERIEIMKESIEVAKPTTMEESGDTCTAEISQDDKSAGEKGSSRTKSVKQLTKEILKLKNTIKEREDEIGDCQMKILSLEERQQKYNELVQINSTYEAKVKTLMEENQLLKNQISTAMVYEQELFQYKQNNELLRKDIQNIQHDYTMTLNMRDSRVRELETVVSEYEKKMYEYANTLQQKDKELAEYINQITKLNDVSQKLKSTIELLEEEKAKDPNAELVKALNKQIATNQKKFLEYEDKIRKLEEEKTQLLSLKVSLESKINSLDIELHKLRETFAENQTLIKDLRSQQLKHDEERSNMKLQLKERDEEVHEVKLQLRKESIENEKLRTALSEKECQSNDYLNELKAIQEKMSALTMEKDKLLEQFTNTDIKNKELMDKLRKFAASVKKKSSMYTELENQLIETQKELESKNLHLEQLQIQIETLPALQEKLKYAEEELNRLQSQKTNLEHQWNQDIANSQTQIKNLQENLKSALSESTKLSEDNIKTEKELSSAREENAKLISQISIISNKLADYELEQKNNLNYTTKISTLEADINDKQNKITELLQKIGDQEKQLSQVQFGWDAKLQERDLYIESLETEIAKYKNRICRLEESISVMEDRRNTLERKADQLGSQLEEKQKAYSEYTSQEDQLVGRLAALIDHDRVVEKQLYEIDNENKELQCKIQHLSEENERLRKTFNDIQDHCNTLEDKANRADSAEYELSKCCNQLHDLESQLKRVTHDYHFLLAERKREIEEIETEFNTQIENAIKEKKVLSEKYEKIIEHVTRLENNVREYQTHNETLKLNIEELSKSNQQLIEKSSQEQSYAPDYTEQYINEINKLNSVINIKNQDILDLNNKLQSVHANNLIKISELQNELAIVNVKLQDSLKDKETTVQKLDILKSNNQELEAHLKEKNEELRRLLEEKTLSFEMTIPKTEGMIISSTIEPLCQGEKFEKQIDWSSIESQIVTKNEDTNRSKTVKSEQFDTTSVTVDDSGEIYEPAVIAKKAYLCYKGESDVTVSYSDPFNSDEGWGLGESEEIEATPGFSQTNEQITQLQMKNDALQSDLNSSNNKLLKAMKKLKELKASNEMLSNELKLSKQISQSSFLDRAIEDEMKLNIQELEKKIGDLTTDLNKEKREKESLRKQNEVFNSANDKLTEMKEKMDSEIELWKYKFKEANDKMSTLQWDADSKNSPAHKPTQQTDVKDDDLRNEFIKLEKENDELQLLVEELSSQNKKLLCEQAQLKAELENLKKLLENKSPNFDINVLNNKLSDLEDQNQNLGKNNAILEEKLQNIERHYNEIIENCRELTTKNEELKNSLNDQYNEFFIYKNEIDKVLQANEIMNSESVHKISSLTSELEAANSKLLYYEQEHNKLGTVNSVELLEKYNSLEINCSQLKQSLDEAVLNVSQLEEEKEIVLRNLQDQEQLASDLKNKLQHLNSENDQLLSTVAELRSSVSSAVDQRGFEIAELWKQHLAQREADFHNSEQELRTQLHAAELKYDQLLDTVQSSSQEETSKLVTMEQVTSLQNKLQEKEDHLRNLQEKYSEVIEQLDILRSEIEDEKVMYENKLFSQQEEYDKQIKEIELKNEIVKESQKEEIENLKQEIINTKVANDGLNAQIEKLSHTVHELEDRLLAMNSQLKEKDREIYQKTHDLTITLAQRNEEFETVRKQLVDYEKKIEDLTYEKESELAVLRLKMHEKVENYEKAHQDIEEDKLSLTQELNAKVVECTTLNKKITDLNKKLEIDASNTAEMQAALENQELEIVTLKDEVANLESMLKSSNKLEKHVTFALNTKPGSETSKKSLEEAQMELLDPVPRAELDLALYMLHQRDVRCEELTMELTQLLEERDTLQLRLSDSLRSYEEIKSRYQSAGLDSLDASHETISELPSFTIEKEQQLVDVHRGQTSRSSSISDPDGDKPKLQAKLSELRSVRHSRDVRLRQDSEQRQLDMRLLQRDVVNLPAEARDQLAQAHHTLSRDSQSTPTVLLNWLRGKSTPKVVDM